jgi:hypothetical protein
MNDIFLACAYSTESHRHAILVDNGITGVLYLHWSSDDGDGTGSVEATSFVYNRIEPPDQGALARYQPHLPPIAKGFASDEAVCNAPESHRWSLAFSTNGMSVVAFRDGVPWSITSLKTRRGYSKAVSTQGPWGNPWSDEVFQSTEWEPLPVEKKPATAK